MCKKKSRILFITRKFPPSVGGMENYAYNLYKLFSKYHNCYKISLGRKQVNLIWFIPWSLIYGFYLCARKKITHVHIGDAVLSPIGLLLKRIFNVKLSITVYGLDLTFNNYLYQLILKSVLPKYPVVVCISRATREIWINKGLPKNNCYIIPCGIDTVEDKVYDRDKDEIINEIYLKLGLKLEGKKILLTVGRLVKRKGVKWFLENVLIYLSTDYVYIIIGDGPEFKEIKKTIDRLGIVQRVYLLGKVSDDIKFLFYSIADIFIMPNIKIHNDMEGFGIVALEAGLYNIPVVASNIDGIKDAVTDKITGFLVQEGNAKEFIDAIIKAEKMEKEKISDFVKKHYSWEKVYENYKSILKLL